jgi:hypothetical protein
MHRSGSSIEYTFLDDERSDAERTEVIGPVVRIVEQDFIPALAGSQPGEIVEIGAIHDADKSGCMHRPVEAGDKDGDRDGDQWPAIPDNPQYGATLSEAGRYRKGQRHLDRAEGDRLGTARGG